MTDEKTRALIAEAHQYFLNNSGSGLAGPDLVRRLADALEALTVPDGDARERLIESIAGGTISIPGGYGELSRDDAENIVDTILGDPVLPHAAATESAIERVRDLHRRSHAVFSWASGGLRYEDPCPECDGKAGVHPCGCWADVDTEYVCSECKVGEKGASVPWPCPTIRAVEAALGGETDGE